MNICFFTNEYPPNIYGGAGVHVQYLSSEISKLSTLSVKCFGDQNINEPNLKVTGVDIDNSFLKGIPSELSFVFKALYKDLKFFQKDFQADIVHCHTWYSHFAGIIAKLAYGLPLVITTHSLEPLRPWKREQTGKGFDMSSWIENQAISISDALIAVSQDTKNDILKHFDVDEKKIHIIPNGIDTEEYIPTFNDNVLEKYNIDANKPYVLFVGRITRQKGIIYLVDAIKHLHNDIQVVLCAGAPDTEEIKKEMEEHIDAAKKIRNNIHWIPQMLSNEEKIILYSHASVFCCPSIYEPFGIINLEAMACETPVVATKIGGIPEIIIDGITGKLVSIDFDKKNNPINPEKFSKDLADNINEIILNKELLKSMGKKSRERAVEIFSWKKIAKKTLNLYNKIKNISI